MSLRNRLIAATCLAFAIAPSPVVAQRAYRAKFEPSGNVVYHGASLPDVWSEGGIRSQLAAYSRAAGKKIAVMTWFASLYEKGSQTSWNQSYYPNLLRVKRLGGVSLIKFSTQDYMFDSNRKQAPLKQVGAGTYDNYFKEAARAVKRFGSPVFISIDHEMNGDWYPYSQAYSKGPKTANAQDFIAAWRRIVSVFRQCGASNAAFVWSPNVNDVGGVSFKNYYPGHAYVDWIGVSLYSSNDPIELDTLYRTYAAKKPFFITEWATSPQKNQLNRNFSGEAAWIGKVFTELNIRYPRIKAISWFNWNQGDGDHRLQRVPQQAMVYRQDVAAPRYLSSAPNLLGPKPTYEEAPIIPPGNENVLVEKVPVQNPRPVAPRRQAPRLQVSRVQVSRVQMVRPQAPRLVVPRLVMPPPPIGGGGSLADRLRIRAVPRR